MAVAIFSQPTLESRFKLANILGLLAGFGLLHGVNEWMDLWTILKGRSAGLDIFRFTLLVASFLFLFEFGRRLFRLNREQYPAVLKKIADRLTWVLCPFIVVGVCVFSALTHDFWESGAMGARYFIAFPSGFLISAGFLLYYHYEKRALEPLKVKKFFWGASLSFLAYGILAGLIVHKGHYGLSPWLNTESFLSETRLPVQVFRAVCAVGAGWSAIGLLKIFNLEIITKLKDEVAWRQQAEEALKRSNEKLREVNQRKSDFVANVSHELKSPLSVIKESTDVLLEEGNGALNERQKEILEIGRSSTDRLMRLVTDLLHLSKIESGKMELKKEKIDIGILVEGVLKTYEGEILTKQLMLQKEIDPSVGFLIGDGDKLTEVIINLLNNAIKYTPQGSLTVKLTGNVREVRFEITDSGPGILPEYREKIFDKFERILTEKQEGSGLGLPIAKDIIELHHGKLWVESEPGKGSTFIFTLPRS